MQHKQPHSLRRSGAVLESVIWVGLLMVIFLALLALLVNGLQPLAEKFL